MGFSLFVLFSFMLILNDHNNLNPLVSAHNNDVFIVYMGKRPHNDPDLITELHHQMLAPVVGSKEAALDSMVYSYRHGFSGFAAKLTKSQAERIAGLPGVVHVIPNHFYTVQTTRSWDYLGLSPRSANNVLHKTTMGDGVIVGILDTGVWPESKAFHDEGLGPIPPHWKGHCVSGDGIRGAVTCNRKLIGAKWYIDGFRALAPQPFNISAYAEYLSPRDASGHGTHTASTAAGSFVHNVSYKGLAAGVLRGGAPKARIAVYKACWGSAGTEQCAAADILQAFDEAVNDGVDLLSLSLGRSPTIPLFSDVDVRDVIAIGSFHAVAKGIPVICAGGNMNYPLAQTISNTAPWILTVAASSIDRAFPTSITLGNNDTIIGQSIFTGQEIGFTNLVYKESPAGMIIANSYCDTLSINDTSVKGKVVLCFGLTTASAAAAKAVSAVRQAGGIGVIVASNPGHFWVPPYDDCPYVIVDHELGSRILLYIRSTRSPTVKISTSKSLIGRPVASKVAHFSARGPNSVAPAILKPDIAAPGVSILAAGAPADSMFSNGVSLQSGTSVAAPHVAGIVALLKALHPQWSPAAIKSAIVTTAWKNDPFGEPIFADGSPRKLADPFDYGGGLVNADNAVEPGLVYDMDTDDYIHYLCAVGYNDTSISLLTDRTRNCPSIKPSILDVNVPSITIPNLSKPVTLSRTVTNVGPVNSTYKARIDPPLGINVVVEPDNLVFNFITKTITFKVIVSTSHQVNTGYYFGSLTWMDEVHTVVTPVSVRTQIIQSYTDEN